MRKRKEIERQVKKIPASLYSQRMQKTQIELLLDIRELLISQNKPHVFLTPTQAVDELFGRLRAKYVKTCDACHVEMRMINQYKNESGAEFHTYQCPKCRGKIDYAQIKGPKGEVGEFSVHSNIVPKEAKKK